MQGMWQNVSKTKRGTKSWGIASTQGYNIERERETSQTVTSKTTDASSLKPRRRSCEKTRPPPATSQKAKLAHQINRQPLKTAGTVQPQDEREKKDDTHQKKGTMGTAIRTAAVQKKQTTKSWGKKEEKT